MRKYSYQEAISFFEELPHFKPPKNTGVPLKDLFSLDAELALLEKFNNPHMDLKYVHVAGTNGKGSTVAYLSSILCEAGIKTGTFSSPFLFSYLEMFVVNGERISEEEFAEIFSRVKPVYEELKAENILPSEYEILTVMAFIYFKAKGCELVVLEVSMGGRVDTTNVIPSPLVTVITPISYDHMSILGNTLTEIATEKCGIIKAGTSVVSAIQEPEVRDVMRQATAEKGVDLDYIREPEIISREIGGQRFKINSIYETTMLGTYQVNNAALAILAAEKLKELGYDISEDSMTRGIKATKWFGRFSLINVNPYIILDGGHNRQGAKVLRESLEQYFPNQKIVFLFGILKDKEIDVILEELLPVAKKCYTMAVSNARTMEPKELAEKIKARGVEAEALENPLPLEGLVEKNQILCVCGSLYMIKQVTCGLK